MEPAEPDEDECRRVYEAQQDKFRTPDLFELAHILIEPACEDEEAWTRAGIQARDLADRLGQDAAAFAEAARTLSDCPSAGQGGSLGQVQKGELAPEVEAVLVMLEPGRNHPEAVRSRFGWHLFRLERRIDGRLLPFEIVRPRIDALLRARAWTTATMGYVEGLVREAEIRGVTLGLGGGLSCSRAA